DAYRRGLRDLLAVRAVAARAGVVVVYGAGCPPPLRGFRPNPKLPAGNRHVPGLIPLKLTIAEIRAAAIVPPVAGHPLAAVERRSVELVCKDQGPPFGLTGRLACASDGDGRRRGRNVSNRGIRSGRRACRAERHRRQEEYLAIHLRNLGYATLQACPLFSVVGKTLA